MDTNFSPRLYIFYMYGLFWLSLYTGVVFCWVMVVKPVLDVLLLDDDGLVRGKYGGS